MLRSHLWVDLWKPAASALVFVMLPASTSGTTSHMPGKSAANPHPCTCDLEHLATAKAGLSLAAPHQLHAWLTCCQLTPLHLQPGASGHSEGALCGSTGLHGSFQVAAALLLLTQRPQLVPGLPGSFLNSFRLCSESLDLCRQLGCLLEILRTTAGWQTRHTTLGRACVRVFPCASYGQAYIHAWLHLT